MKLKFERKSLKIRPMGKSKPPIKSTAAFAIGFGSARTGREQTYPAKKIKQEHVENRMYRTWSRQDFLSS